MDVGIGERGALQVRAYLVVDGANRVIEDALEQRIDLVGGIIQRNMPIGIGINLGRAAVVHPEEA